MLYRKCYTFYMFSQNCKTAIISFVMSVCLSFSVEKLGFHWTDFHEILYLNTFQKSVEMIPVSLKSDKNNGYLPWRGTYIYDISLHSSSNDKFFGQKL